MMLVSSGKAKSYHALGSKVCEPGFAWLQRTRGKAVSAGSHEPLAKGVIQWAQRGKLLLREVLLMDISTSENGSPSPTFYSLGHLKKFPNLQNGNNPVLFKVFHAPGTEHTVTAASRYCLPGAVPLRSAVLGTRKQVFSQVPRGIS